MFIEEGVVQALIRNDPSHLRVRARTWTLVAMTGLDAMRTLYPIWDRARQTFEARLAAGPPYDDRAREIAEDYVLQVPPLVGAYRRGDYPVEFERGNPDDLVVFDGCHRILAIALRAKWDLRLPRVVGVFVEVK